MVSTLSFAPKIASSLTIIWKIEDFDFDHGTSIAIQLGEDRKPQGAYKNLNGADITMGDRYHGFALLYLWLYSHQMDALSITQDCPDRVVWVLGDFDLFWIGKLTRRFKQMARRVVDCTDSYTPLMEQIIDRLRTWAITTQEELPEWIELVPIDSPLAKILQERLGEK